MDASVQRFQAQPAAWQVLSRDLPAERVSHALLITGAEGTGKRTLAKAIAMGLVCQGADKPCGVCPACVQAASGAHPDITFIRPGEPIASGEEKGKKAIPVADIREAARIVSVQAYESAHRIVVIEQADKMTPSAQNALLKILEEPPQGVHFLLLTDTPGALLPTIHSRCRNIPIKPWPEGFLSQLLRQEGVPADRALLAARRAGGSISRARQLSSSEDAWQLQDRVRQTFFGLRSRSGILPASNDFKGDRAGALDALDQIEDMLRLLTGIRLGQADPALAASFPEDWQKIAKTGSYAGLVRLQDAVMDARMCLESNVSPQAVLERLMFQFMEEKDLWQKS